MHSLSYLVQFFIGPLNWSLFALGAAAFALHRGCWDIAKRWLAVSAFILLFSSIAIVPYELVGHLEQIYPSRPIEEYPHADAILVLGGSASVVQGPRHESEEMGDSRLLPAARLFKLGKANLIVVSGGSPYHDQKGRLHTEADDEKQILIDMGIPKDAILTETDSGNTLQDVSFSAKLMEARQIHSVLLVTSAYHMARTMKAAKRTPLTYIPVPTGHQVTFAPIGFRSFLPEAGAIAATTLAIREFVGIWISDLRDVS